MHPGHRRGGGGACAASAASSKSVAGARRRRRCLPPGPLGRSWRAAPCMCGQEDESSCPLHYPPHRRPLPPPPTPTCRQGRWDVNPSAAAAEEAAAATSASSAAVMARIPPPLPPPPRRRQRRRRHLFFRRGCGRGVGGGHRLRRRLHRQQRSLRRRRQQQRRRRWRLRLLLRRLQRRRQAAAGAAKAAGTAETCWPTVPAPPSPPAPHAEATPLPFTRPKSLQLESSEFNPELNCVGNEALNRTAGCSGHPSLSTKERYRCQQRFACLPPAILQIAKVESVLQTFRIDTQTKIKSIWTFALKFFRTVEYIIDDFVK
jgi:hypothetical protein